MIIRQCLSQLSLKISSLSSLKSFTALPYTDLRPFAPLRYLFRANQTKCKTCCYCKKIKSTALSISRERCQNHRTKFSLKWIQVSVRFNITQMLFDLNRRKTNRKDICQKQQEEERKINKKKFYKSPKPKYASKCTFPVPSSSLADSLTYCASL